jgi:hypothetical protein
MGKSKELIAGILILLISSLLVGCSGDSESRATQKGTELWFEENLHDYGEIVKDGDGTWSFAFKNLGKEAVVINRVRSTCGCTVPEWPREPIEPGASGEITVEYNTSTTGTFLKSVFVYSTAANSPVKLQIKGRVVAPE